MGARCSQPARRMKIADLIGPQYAKWIDLAGRLAHAGPQQAPLPSSMPPCGPWRSRSAPARRGRTLEPCSMRCVPRPETPAPRMGESGAVYNHSASEPGVIPPRRARSRNCPTFRSDRAPERRISPVANTDGARRGRWHRREQSPPPRRADRKARRAPHRAASETRARARLGGSAACDSEALIVHRTRRARSADPMAAPPAWRRAVGIARRLARNSGLSKKAASRRNRFARLPPSILSDG